MIKNEFSVGILNAFRNSIGTSTLGLAIIFFVGHIIIAMNVVYWMTGSSLWEAGAVALVEPCINGFWFYILHKIWKKHNERKTKHSK